uniref:C-type lectin domain-containing protein n=1 Tax=Panagrolaimus sp. JU765 TaxID=591449 RepID=A0AC34QFV0_9BILA
MGDGTTAKTQADAQAACAASAPGANLVSIHSTAENDYVLSISKSTSSAATNDGYLRSTWIGLSLVSEVGTLQTFKWSDGTPVDFPAGNPYTTGMGPSPWAQGVEPQAAGGDCVTMITNTLSLNPPFIYGAWNNIKCASLVFNYVCKKPA